MISTMSVLEVGKRRSLLAFRAAALSLSLVKCFLSASIIKLEMVQEST